MLQNSGQACICSEGLFWLDLFLGKKLEELYTAVSRKIGGIKRKSTRD